MGAVVAVVVGAADDFVGAADDVVDAAAAVVAAVAVVVVEADGVDAGDDADGGVGCCDVEPRSPG